MAVYILRRLLMMVPTLFGIMLVSFIVTQFVPGGPVEKLISEIEGYGGGAADSLTQVSSYRGDAGLDEEQIRQLEAQFGFDKPVYYRFYKMMKNYLVFDFGDSYYHHSSVAQLVLSKLPVSMSLGLWSFMIVYGVCVPLGIIKAMRHGSKFDTFTTSIILVGYAIPGFVLGLVLLVFFGGGSFLDIFPLRGVVSDDWGGMSVWMKILDYLWHMFLPVVSGAVGSLAVMTMLTKNSFLEEINKQYVLTARAKGLGEKDVMVKHVLRNAIIPIITGFPGYFIASFFAGSLLIETIFSLDGMGLLAYNSVLSRDYPVVLGTLYFFSMLGLVARLLSDISYMLVDPRITFGSVE